MTIERVILLCAGDKLTQQRNIKRARELQRDVTQAARCAFMRLISPGFRSLRAIFRS